MAKDLYEQFSEYTKIFTDCTKHSAKPVQQFAELAGSTFERVARQNLNMMNEVTGTLLKHSQTCASVKKPEELLPLNLELANAQTTKYIDYAQQTLDTFVELSTAYSKLMSKMMDDGMHSFTEQQHHLNTKVKSATSSSAGKATA